MIIWVLAAAAAVALLWPAKAASPVTFSPIKPMDSHKPSASYLETVSALHLVRQRLNSHGTLDESERAAIETLMLALLIEEE